MFDHGPDDSAAVIRGLADSHPFVRPVWLSRNFGQHAATLAGMASAGADWILTMDEDGQHDPAFIASFLDCALRDGAALVYASPTNPAARETPPFDVAPRQVNLINVLADAKVPPFHSYRLILGEIGRSIAAYAGSNVYLDVALTWVTESITVCPVVLRQEGDRPSGYSTRKLFSHFWKLVLTSGTRPLRLVSLTGFSLAVAGFLLAAVLLVGRITDRITVQGWTTLMVAILVSTGVVLFCLGVIAEYIGVAVRMAMGQPAYLILTDPMRGPLGRPLPSSDT